MTPFTIVIATHDSAPDLPALLDSIELFLRPRPQVVVVDSGSRDDGPALARSAGAEVVELGENRGFGAASNAGVAAAREAVCVLLNPDCVLRDDALARLAALAAGHDALLVPRLLDGRGAVQRSAHPLPGVPSALVRAVVPTRLLPEPHRARQVRRVGWAIAACLAAPTALLRRLGPFDPAAFLFYEDLDLCLRARVGGVPTVLHPELAVTHLGGTSTGRAFGGEAFELQAHRRREVVRARLGARALAVDDAAQALTFGLRAAVGRERARNLAALRALRHDRQR
jgi:N-acetylglucosaminyl-diphospho-decaprenol L-rhamnosyltransferase